MFPCDHGTHLHEISKLDHHLELLDADFTVFHVAHISQTLHVLYLPTLGWCQRGQCRHIRQSHGVYGYVDASQFAWQSTRVDPSPLVAVSTWPPSRAAAAGGTGRRVFSIVVDEAMGNQCRRGTWHLMDLFLIIII